MRLFLAAALLQAAAVVGQEILDESVGTVTITLSPADMNDMNGMNDMEDMNDMEEMDMPDGATESPDTEFPDTMYPSNMTMYPSNMTMFPTNDTMTAMPSVSMMPSEAPTTLAPTASPSASPIGSPTASPTAPPTASPSASPSASPTASPSASPTFILDPTESPTGAPTESPTGGNTGLCTLCDGGGVPANPGDIVIGPEGQVTTCGSLDVLLGIFFGNDCSDFDGVLNGVQVDGYCNCPGATDPNECPGICFGDPVLDGSLNVNGLTCDQWDNWARHAIDTDTCDGFDEPRSQCCETTSPPTEAPTTAPTETDVATEGGGLRHRL